MAIAGFYLFIAYWGIVICLGVIMLFAQLCTYVFGNVLDFFATYLYRFLYPIVHISIVIGFCYLGHFLFTNVLFQRYELVCSCSDENYYSYDGFSYLDSYLATNDDKAFSKGLEMLKEEIIRRDKDKGQRIESFYIYNRTCRKIIDMNRFPDRESLFDKVFNKSMKYAPSYYYRYNDIDDYY